MAFFREGLEKYGGPKRKEVEALFRWLVNLPEIRAGQKSLQPSRQGLNLLACPEGLVVPKNFQELTESQPSPLVYLGLVRRDQLKKRSDRRRTGIPKVSWHYPSSLDPSLVLDLISLEKALAPAETLNPKPLTLESGGTRANSNQDKSTERIYLSSATLVVVPANLVPHWRSQILQHTYFGQLKVFVWDGMGTKPPSPHNLAWDYDIVITTFTRLSVEWNGGGRMGGGGGPLGGGGAGEGGGVSMLMRVHWLRVILDEGHTLGASLALTNKLQMAVALRAERRWILTGTPTPNTPSSQVAHLQPLLKFLHEGVFGEQQRLWELAIQRPFEAGREEGRVRLEALLRRCMMSALKSSIKLLPKCFRKVILLEFSQGHAAAYNELVETVQRNILTADWGDPDHIESLLNPKQWKLARELLNNVRLSCCVSGHMQIRDVGTDIAETMDLLEKEGLSRLADRWRVIQLALKYGGNCDRCEEWCRLPMVTPCRHLLCIACVALDREHCTVAGCGRGYKMQSNKLRPENPNPKWTVPEDLIELQPSYAQEMWCPDWTNTASSKAAYLVRQLQKLQKENEKLFHKQANLAGAFSFDLPEDPGSRKLFSPGSEGSAPAVQASSREEGKGASGSGAKRSRREESRLGGELPENHGQEKKKSWWQRRGGLNRTEQPYKAIVFSQFLEHISLVELQLSKANIRTAGMYSPRPSADKRIALEEFAEDPECLVLLMDSQGSLGLDLSFATHVFLMEPIWDRSVEEQVIARAWRMGAQRDVCVETLAMRGTIEEHMLAHLQDPAERGRARSQREMQELTARTDILKRLAFVRTSSASASASASAAAFGSASSASPPAHKPPNGDLPPGTLSRSTSPSVPASASPAPPSVGKPTNENVPPGDLSPSTNHSAGPAAQLPVVAQPGQSSEASQGVQAPSSPTNPQLPAGTGTGPQTDGPAQPFEMHFKPDSAGTVMLTSSSAMLTSSSATLTSATPTVAWDNSRMMLAPEAAVPRRDGGELLTAGGGSLRSGPQGTESALSPEVLGGTARSHIPGPMAERHLSSSSEGRSQNEGEGTLLQSPAASGHQEREGAQGRVRKRRVRFADE